MRENVQSLESVRTLETPRLRAHRHVCEPKYPRIRDRNRHRVRKREAGSCRAWPHLVTPKGFWRIRVR